MFREMRRNRQALSYEECETILNRATSGVLAVSGDDGYPYAVPLSYVYADSKIYFHCALTTYFRSVIAFGRAKILTDAQKKRAALELLAARYSPDQPEGRQQEVDTLFKNVCMVEISIEHMTGKEAIELVREKANQNG